MVLQVFQQVNRPTYRASFLYDLTIRDDTYGVNGGSNEQWVRYLQNGGDLLAFPPVACPGRPRFQECSGVLQAD